MLSVQSSDYPQCEYETCAQKQDLSCFGIVYFQKTTVLALFYDPHLVYVGAPHICSVFCSVGNVANFTKVKKISIVTVSEKGIGLV